MDDLLENELWFLDLLDRKLMSDSYVTDAFSNCLEKLYIGRCVSLTGQAIAATTKTAPSKTTRQWTAVLPTQNTGLVNFLRNLFKKERTVIEGGLRRYMLF
jgi:hypothetical protein